MEGEVRGVEGVVVTIFSEVLVPGVSEPVSSWACHSQELTHHLVFFLSVLVTFP